MKILYVLEYYHPHIGGVETLFKNIAESSVEAGHQVRVVTTKLSNTKSKETINEVEIIRLAFPKLLRRYWFGLLAFFWLIKYARGYDLIHTTVYNAAWPAFLISKFYNIKTIITVHEVWQSLWFKLPSINKFSAWLHKCYERFILYLHFDIYIVPSKFTYQKLSKFINKDISQIYHGIDYEHFNPNIKKDKRIFNSDLMNKYILLYYGRPGIAKGLEYLINALPVLSQEINNIHLLLILSRDPISNYRNLIKLIKKLKLSDKVTIIDSVAYNDLPKFISSVDCVVIPSLSEGFCFNAAESSVLPVPVAASNAGSIPEVISGHYQLFNPGDVESLKNAVTKIYKKEFIDREVIKFDWQDSINKHKQIYNQLISGVK